MILVTGGAGFIGSHLVDALVERGEAVRVLDSLDPQVHGEGATQPSLIAGHVAAGRVEFLHGDVTDPDAVERALDGVDVVFHQAAAVGVGQSMYRIVDYVRANTLGAAVLLEAMTARRDRIRRAVVASSMSIYGEGAYRCPEHGTVAPPPRPAAQLESGDFELRCPHCARSVAPEATPESKPLQPTSVYAVSKRDHEELFLSVGAAYEIPTVALRYFNVYGPRQSLSNPYTGVAAIFASRLLNRLPPLVFEDGLQSRDFVHVRDIVRANLRALDADPGAAGVAYNVGTGRSLSLLDMIRALRDPLGGPEPQVVERFRQGDIRHCYADVSRARDGLGFEAEVAFEEGIDDLVAWAVEQSPEDRVDQATSELDEAGLTLPTK
ncbi:MAG: NAD-dependent epimerase/dehydratase family protein [Gemmatimonadota bacterium]